MELVNVIVTRAGTGWTGSAMVRFGDGEMVSLQLASDKDPKIEAACAEFARALEEALSRRIRDWT